MGSPSTLMVPEALAGAGSRGARLGPHGNKAARRATGLEGALIDRERMEIRSLDPGVERSVAMLVAGPAALLVAKVHKIAERTGTGNRVSDKDALDALRLLQAIDTATFAAGLAQLANHELSAAVTAEAVSQLAPLFGSPDSVGRHHGSPCGPCGRRGRRDCRFVHCARVGSPHPPRPSDGPPTRRARRRGSAAQERRKRAVDDDAREGVSP